MTMRTIFAVICITALLTGCVEKVQNPPAAGENVQLPPIEWRVRDQRGLDAAYVASGKVLGEGEKLKGFAGYSGGKAVVYTLPPTGVDDGATLTLGHEVLHIARGDYHQ